MPRDYPKINRKRLLERHSSIAAIGATGRGGVNRQALTDADIRARSLLLSWATARNFACSADEIGNIFVRRNGRNGEADPVLAGSHLDSQPAGGNFDGVFGTLAALEVLETLEDVNLCPYRPMELVVWTNEEGARFPPPTMGSAVFAGAMALNDALRTVDGDGVSVSEALGAMWQALPWLARAPHTKQLFAYLEAHIEQGPILERTGKTIGVVTGIQGMRVFTVCVFGEEAHAGTTPVRLRKDAFSAAIDVVGALRKICEDPQDVVRFTIGQFVVLPGASNTVPSRVEFTIDLRHRDAKVLTQLGDCILAVPSTYRGPCQVKARELLNSQSVTFDASVRRAISSHAERNGFPQADLLSGATHDGKFLAALCPAGMVFIPCRNGISHNEQEFASPEHLVAGAQVLADTAVDLANRQ